MQTILIITNIAPMKKYDEIWAADSAAIQEFFNEHPGDVSVISLPDKVIGAMRLPQTRVVIEGDNAAVLYQQFFRKFMKAGG